MKYFGTDGIRDKANQGLMTPDMSLKIGRAFGNWLKTNNPDVQPVSAVLGQDTRVSGDMLASAVAAGVSSTGVHVYLTKVMPTPAIAYLTKHFKFDGGLVISASHNPYFDNGIKLFKTGGYKLNDHDETAIENLINAGPGIKNCEPGNINLLPAHDEIYCDFICRDYGDKSKLSELKIVFDCANGAASVIAKKIFVETLGIQAHFLHDRPNGININANCGSEHPQSLVESVLKYQADAGFAFDGDADRLIAVDGNGEVLSGDCIIAILAKLLKAQGLLRNNAVVTTLMSNLGLKQALNAMGIDHFVTNVGDRNVFQEMQVRGAVLGGEDSGHIVFLDKQTIGDGILSALRLMEAMVYFKKPLAQFADIINIYPQKLINVNVKHKPDLNTQPAIEKVIKNAESQLQNQGRVFVRYSGTQPMCRVMVEGADFALVTKLCEEIAAVVQKTLN